MPVPTQDEIDAARSPRGQWTRDTLAQWGVPWPPPKGWRNRLIRESGGVPTKSPTTTSKRSATAERRKRGERTRKQVNWLADLLLAIGQGPSAKDYLLFFKMTNEEIREHTSAANGVLGAQQGTKFAKPPQVYRAGLGPAQKRMLGLQGGQRREVLRRLGLDPNFPYWEPEPVEEREPGR